MTFSSSRPVSAARHVLSAGVVVGRPGGEVLLVHRPKYDDWSFPKGKLDRGEVAEVAAVREVAEETGLRVRLGVRLADQHYPIKAGTKQVHYWSGRVLGDDRVVGYSRGSEIDEVRWVPWRDALEVLTYPYDRDTLCEARGRPRRVDTLLILRHARARARSRWHEPDQDRPLIRAGERQAERLVPVLSAFAPEYVLCSTSLRCRATIAPFLRARRVPERFDVTFTDLLSEEGADRERLRRLVTELLGRGGHSLVCSHRPLLPEVFATLGVADVRLDPGAALVLHHRAGKVLASQTLAAPRSS